MALVSLSVDAGPSASAASLAPDRATAKTSLAVDGDARLGLNLDDLGLSGSVVFSDAMKQASPWSSDGPLQLDADGNVQRLTAGQSAQTVIYPYADYPSGDYSLLYDGRGTFAIDPGSGTLTQVSSGRAIVHVVARPGFGIRLRLTATDPSSYVRNVRLILPGLENQYESAPFAPSFLAQVSHYNVLRFVHWSHGDTMALPSTWPTHPTVTQLTQAGPRGAAWEYQIALANAVGADPWFVLPVGASNFYVTQVASLIHARLDPRLHPMFEYAPDAWRPGSPVNAYATMAGRNFRLATAAQPAALGWYSLRSTQVFALIKAVFAADAGRVVRVLGGAAATPGSAADAANRFILAHAGSQADVLAVDFSGAAVASRAYMRAVARQSGLPLAAAGGALSLTGVRDAASSTQGELAAWHAAGGGLFAAGSLMEYLAETGALGRVPVAPRVQAESLRQSALAAYGREYPSAHIMPRPLDARGVLAPMQFPNAYTPSTSAALPGAAGAPVIPGAAATASSTVIAPRVARVPTAPSTAVAAAISGPARALAPRPVPALTPTPGPANLRRVATAPASASSGGAVGFQRGRTKAGNVKALDASAGIAINVGGPAIGGTKWVADTGGATGGRVSGGTTVAIDTSKAPSPAPMAVYQSGWVGTSFTYGIQGLAPSTAYTVRLHFAEYSYSTANDRLFSVAINGATVLSNFDIFSAAGGEYIAVIKAFQATSAANGTIALTFTAQRKNAIINGIEIIPSGATPSPTPSPTATPHPTPTPTSGPAIDINGGGPAISGTSWVADEDYNGGSLSSGTKNSIDTSKVSDPAPMAVYQSGRVGTSFSYTIPGLSTSATYTVRLHFAEYFNTVAGARIFSVTINGTQVLSNFDIYAAAGANTAIIESFTAHAASGGTITIGFTASKDKAIINGIQIISGSSGPTPTPSPTPSPTPTTTTQAGDILTYHGNNMRTGWNQSERSLNTTNVASTFGLRQTINVDGLVLAQPLYVSNYPINGVNHNLLIVATEHNSVYAFDADTFALYWQVNLGTSQSSLDISQATGAGVNCTDIEPEYGISSTPAIDRSSGRIYVVAATEPSSNVFHTTIHALSLGSGSDVVTPQTIAATNNTSYGTTISFSDSGNLQRASLLLANNSVYVGFGSHCDDERDSLTGWLMRYSTSNLAQLAAFNTIDDGPGQLTEPSGKVISVELGSIWGGGFGPAADASGNIYAVTGNGPFDADVHSPTNGKNYGMSVLKFGPSLSAVTDWFTYPNEAADAGNDADFGSGGAMLMPTQSGSGLNPLVAMGKPGIAYLLDQSNLRSSVNNGLASANTNRFGLRGGPAYYNGPSGPTIFYQPPGLSASGPLLQYSLNASGGTPTLTLAQTASTAYASGNGGSIPAVSSNGTTAGTGVVWVARHVAAPNNSSVGSIILDAYDATNVTRHLFAAAAGNWSHHADNCFVTPLIANGRVYVGAYKTVTVFGL